MDLEYGPSCFSKTKMECSWSDKPQFDSPEHATGSLLFVIFLWIFVDGSM
jgi:hypothetical protein